MLRVGVVGLGRQGQRHLSALSEVPGVEVVAVCDADAAKVVETLPRWPQARGYHDATEMLATARLDVLSVVTLGPTHPSMVIDAAKAGVGRILCEKPIATSLAQADLMVEACQRRGVRLAINHSRRWWSVYRALVGRLNDGSLGSLAHVHYTCGGGRLGAVGSHAFDTLRLLCGADAVRLQAELDTDLDPDPRGHQFADLGGFAVVHFANGIRGTVQMEKRLGVPPLCDLVCTDGRVRIDETAGQITIGSRPLDAQQLPSHRRYAVPLQYETLTTGSLDMVALTRAALVELCGDGSLSCDGRDGRAALELVVACHLSQRRGSAALALPLIGADTEAVLGIA